MRNNKKKMDVNKKNTSNLFYEKDLSASNREVQNLFNQNKRNTILFLANDNSCNDVVAILATKYDFSVHFIKFTENLNKTDGYCAIKINEKNMFCSLNTRVYNIDKNEMKWDETHIIDSDYNSLYYDLLKIFIVNDGIRQEIKPLILKEMYIKPIYNSSTTSNEVIDSTKSIEYYLDSEETFKSEFAKKLYYFIFNEILIKRYTIPEKGIIDTICNIEKVNDQISTLKNNDTECYKRQQYIYNKISELTHELTQIDNLRKSINSEMQNLRIISDNYCSDLKNYTEKVMLTVPDPNSRYTINELIKYINNIDTKRVNETTIKQFYELVKGMTYAQINKKYGIKPTYLTKLNREIFAKRDMHLGTRIYKNK